MSGKGPTFMKVYIIPVLLLNFLIGGWTLLILHVVHGLMIYLGYAVIITVGLRLYLAYLDSYDAGYKVNRKREGSEKPPMR